MSCHTEILTKEENNTLLLYVVREHHLTYIISVLLSVLSPGKINKSLFLPHGLFQLPALSPSTCFAYKHAVLWSPSVVRLFFQHKQLGHDPLLYSMFCLLTHLHLKYVLGQAFFQVYGLKTAPSQISLTSAVISMCVQRQVFRLFLFFFFAAISSLSKLVQVTQVTEIPGVSFFPFSFPPVYPFLSLYI